MNHHKQSFNFLLSCFSRIYGVNNIDPKVIYFCKEWVSQDREIPKIELSELDHYILEQYKIWKKEA